MTTKKETKPRDYRTRSVPDAALLAYRAGVDDMIAKLGALAGGPHWVRHTRYDCATYTALIAGHRLNVWQADVTDWRVTLDVGGNELALMQAPTATAGRAAALAWAQAHDARKVRLVRKLHMGFRTWGLDDTAFLPVAAESAGVLTLA